MPHIVSEFSKKVYCWCTYFRYEVSWNIWHFSDYFIFLTVPDLKQYYFQFSRSYIRHYNIADLHSKSLESFVWPINVTFPHWYSSHTDKRRDVVLLCRNILIRGMYFRLETGSVRNNDDLKIIPIDAFKACYFFFSLKYVVGLRNIYFVSGKLSFNIDRPIICKKIRYNWPIGQHRVTCTQFWNVYSSATSWLKIWTLSWSQK